MQKSKTTSCECPLELPLSNTFLLETSPLYHDHILVLFCVGNLSTWQFSMQLGIVFVGNRLFYFLTNQRNKMHQSKILVVKLRCHSVYMRTRYTVRDSKFKIEAWILHIVISKRIFFLFWKCHFFLAFPLFYFSQLSLYQGYWRTDFNISN